MFPVLNSIFISLKSFQYREFQIKTRGVSQARPLEVGLCLSCFENSIVSKLPKTKSACQKTSVLEEQKGRPSKDGRPELLLPV